jgi:Domain of unknown function (DUF4249)
MIMQKIMFSNFSVFALLLVGFLMSCETPYIPPTTEADQLYVVEGYIEEGEGSLPTYVLVTKSIPYLSTIGPDVFANIFVKNASVVVNDGDKNIQLTKLCLNDLPDELRKAALENLGLNPDSTVLDICLYVDILNQINKKQGGKYDLSITIEDQLLTATTTIPKHVPITKFRWDEPPGIPNDTFARLWVTIGDNLGVKDYYRYMTSDKNINTLVAPPQSSNDDSFFDGKNFEFPLNKAEQRDSTSNFDTFGLYMRGDSVAIKWMNIDAAHYGFWQTRDASANRGGPFSSYIRIKSNIKGGLGVWGGYSVSNYTLYCPPK